ncbi:hypothetical protein F2Q68_00019587 [Brassica cretica]|uniref:Uncharacterized protein n=1 Tax=Brassica cretica TaxID=69181 RepID=A0A8S9FUY7_BRACR|nr:hypothetical protein F2Q68_00019587 [Brassica cretica]
MTSRKRSSKKKTSPQSSSGNPCTNEEIVPKKEFEVEQEEKEAYWDALCGSITPPPKVFYPTRPATQLDPTLPSRTSPAYLKTLREFYRVPSGVVFRVPVHGESAEDPPERFFTCYEAFLTCCRMWFPILEAIVRALDRFELSISQLNAAALLNFLGVLILSYELGMDLSSDEFEGLWSTRKTSIDYSYRMAPKRHMSIIQGHTSNAKGWFERFFYVRIDSASVEENCLPLLHGKWNFHRANSILPAIPRDLFAKCDLLCDGPFFWDSFTLDRIQNAVAYRSRGISRPLCASDMDEPHPDAVPDQRERVRPRKDKGIALEDRNFVSEDLPLLGWNPGFTPGDGSGTSEAPLPDDFFANLPPGFTTPASLDEASRREVVAEGSRLINEGMRVFNSTLHGSFREARLSHFKAEEIKRKFIRFQNEFAERERRQAESHSRALIRAERKGRRTITAELAGELHCLMLSSGASRMLKTMWVTSANVAVRLVPFGSRRTLISLFSPRLLKCRASWMGAPRPSRWFLQSRGGSESFGNPSRFRRTRRRREPMLQTSEEKWISPGTHLEP